MVRATQKQDGVPARMVTWISQPAVVTALLLVLAALTPAVSWWVTTRRRPVPRRPWIAAGLAGPVSLAVWGILVALQTVFGFASIVGILLFLLLCAAVGTRAGLWIRGEPAP